jgi:endonuclease/exonuclease/phosphatase family metal-dependent hydrolase
MRILRCHRVFRSLAALLVAVAVLNASGAPASAAVAAQSTNAFGGPLTVMTRNMYIGTDLRPIISAQTGPQFVAAAATGYGQVLASNPAERAKAIAKEILLTQPDVVSLQEVYQWRMGPVFDPAPAATVSVDQLVLLQSALADLHLRYAPVVLQVNADLEAPVPAPGINADLRLIDRDVILARTDLSQSLLKVTNPMMGHYAAALAFTSPVLGPITIKRGWVSIDVTRFGRTARVVNTHLESFNPAIPATGVIQRAQNAQLLSSVVGATTKPVLLSGDFNSGPSASNAAERPPIEAYNDTLAAGFIDTWAATRSPGPGYTWPINTGDSRSAATPDQRIDHVFVRGAVQPLVDVRTGALKTPYGFYASDHLGLVAYTWLHR